jgi:AraC-like DNA-binding protein
MGRIFHSVSQLPYPLLLTDERLILLPRDREMKLRNTAVKFVFFIEADLAMEVSGHPRPLKIDAGDIFTAPPGVEQTYRSLRGRKERMRVHRIVLAPDVITSARTEGPLLARSFREFHHLPKAMTPRHHKLLARLRQETEDQAPGYRLMSAGLCLELVALTLRLLKPRVTGRESARGEPGVPEATTDQHVRGAQELIIENFRRPLTLDEIAWSVRLSREHLCRIFRAETGTTVFDYLARHRIEMAKGHLCESGLLVEEIAEMVGFSSAALFCRTFRRVTGASPSEYRRRAIASARFNPSMLDLPPRRKRPPRRT